LPGGSRGLGDVYKRQAIRLTQTMAYMYLGNGMRKLQHHSTI
jgi:hypothetical protein